MSHIDMIFKFLLFLSSHWLVVFSSARGQADTILNRYQAYILQNTPPENTRDLLVTLQTQSQWPDIDYHNIQPANWPAALHLKRTRDLALSWADPQSSYYHSPVLWAALEGVLNHWLEKRYQNPNWWHNEIGVPQIMRDILVLLRKKLSSEQFRQALEVLAQYQIRGTGANLTWSADLGLHYGALTHDADLIRQCSKLISQEIKISTQEGIQPDYSFHQHGPRLQIYHYGKAFLTSNVRLAWQLLETPWAIPEEKTRILADFVLKGWQWMARGIHTVPGTIDRSVSRIDQLHSPDIRDLVPYLIELCPKQKEALQALAQRQRGTGQPLTGYRYYPYSDFSVYHQKDFSFFLKTLSDRTLPTESINQENLKGQLLHSGDAYLIRNGSEYFNLMPVWQWEFLPGITSFKGAEKISRRPFVGGVSNQESGLTVMDYVLGNAEQSQYLTAHKYWASHDGLVVCLIAGLQTNHQEAIYTVLDQSRWQGKVTVNELTNVLQAGSYQLPEVHWMHHDGLAYILLEPAALQIDLNAAEGTWSSINASLSEEPLLEKTLTARIQHGVSPQEKVSGYVLAAHHTPKQTQLLANSPTWQVLSNDTACQALRFRDGTVMAAFFSPSTLKLSSDNTLTVDRSCLVLIDQEDLYVSDPTHTGGKIKISYNDQIIPIPVPKDGTTSEGLSLKQSGIPE